jgi:hypothetical protein
MDSSLGKRKANEITLEFQKKLRDSTIDFTVKELLFKKKDNNGRLPQGAMIAIIRHLASVGIKTDRDHLNYLMAKESKKLSLLSQVLPTINNPPNAIVINDCTDIDISTITDEDSLHRRGRPQGSSLITMVNNKSIKTKCINEITEIYAKERENICCNYKKLIY